MPKRKEDRKEDSDNEWQKSWGARKAALESILGVTDQGVFHAVVPLYLGGHADVLCFHPPGMGVTYVTSDLIGDDSQLRNDLGNYELMICLRKKADWAPSLISRLARYTLEAQLNPWETMDIGPALPKGSSLTAFAFLPYETFKVRRRKCGLMLCLGITADEFQAYHQRGPDHVIDRLKRKGVFPFTDVRRKSVLKHNRE